MNASIPKMFWVFDVLSPFAYLELKRLPELPGAERIEYVPVLLAGLLDHHGQIGPAEIAPKRRFTYRFVLWQARKMGIPMRMPPAHPFNPLSALRLIIAAGSTRAAVERVFDAVFLQGYDVTDAGVLRELAAGLGVADPQVVLAAPVTKQKLRDNTAWAIERGVFGVPTLLVGEEIFWGQDAFEMARDFVRDPAAFADRDMRALESLPVGASRPRPEAV